jgi:ankyrin repeat protein
MITSNDEETYSPAHWASYNDDIELFNTLSPQNISVTSNMGSTCLHIAVANNSIRVFESIISSRCININSQNNWGETALHIAAGVNNTYFTERLLSCGVNWTLRDKWARTAQKVYILS